MALTTLAVLVGQVLVDSQGFLDTTCSPARPRRCRRSRGPGRRILASLYLGALVFLFSVPIGVATAIYLEEYAAKDRWYNRLLELNIQNLAGVPSIVYGILGLAFLVRGLGLGRTLLAGALILTLLVLPTVIIASREALRSVPPSIRDGAYALGATPWQVTWRQVLPAAIPGHRHRLDPGAVAGDRRDGAAAAGRRARRTSRFDPTLTSGFTALPVQIYNWVEAAAAGRSVPGGRGYRGAARHAADAELRGDPAAQSLPEEMVR